MEGLDLAALEVSDGLYRSRPRPADRLDAADGGFQVGQHVIAMASPEYLQGCRVGARYLARRKGHTGVTQRSPMCALPALGLTLLPSIITTYCIPQYRFPLISAAR